MTRGVCADPSAPVVECAVCHSEVHTCERTSTEDDDVNFDYRCPVHPNGVQDSRGRWACSESCYWRLQPAPKLTPMNWVYISAGRGWGTLEAEKLARLLPSAGLCNQYEWWRVSGVSPNQRCEFRINHIVGADIFVAVLDGTPTSFIELGLAFTSKAKHIFVWNARASGSTAAPSNLVPASQEFDFWPYSAYSDRCTYFEGDATQMAQRLKDLEEDLNNPGLEGMAGARVLILDDEVNDDDEYEDGDEIAFHAALAEEDEEEVFVGGKPLGTVDEILNDSRFDKFVIKPAATRKEEE